MKISQKNFGHFEVRRKEILSQFCQFLKLSGYFRYNSLYQHRHGFCDGLLQ